MLEVQPFGGLRYDAERIPSLSAVICPPYDVISPTEQQRYHDKSPYNVIRLELGKELPEDTTQSNKYTRAGAQLKAWQEQGILIQEKRPAFYVFQHCFTYQGAVRKRWGLTAAVRLEDWSTRQVRPHEAIFRKPIQDRLTLLHSCPVNISPILGLCHQPKDTLMDAAPQLTEGKPALQATDDYGVTHQMWIVTEPEGIRRLSGLYASGALYIADGHHRYETALAYQKEQRTLQGHSSGRESYNFTMINVMDAADPGVLALPPHRLVRLPAPHLMSQLKDKMHRLFSLEELPHIGLSPSENLKVWLDTMEKQGKKRKVIGVYGLGGKRLYLLSPRDESSLQKMLPAEHSQAWKELDVSLLHWVIIRGLAGIDSSTDETDHIAYTQDALQAIARVESGEFHLAFLLNPMPVSSVMAVADASDRMPHKSTYFYPKPPTGLVMHPLWPATGG